MTAVSSSSGVQGCGSAPNRNRGVVGLGAQHELVAALNGGQGVGQLGVDEEHVGAAVLHDVGHLVQTEAEVDGDEQAAVAADTPEAGEQPARVVRHHGDATPHSNAERVEAGAGGVGQLAEAPEGHLAHRRGGLVGLIDEGDPVGIDDQGAVKVVADSERNLHGLIMAAAAATVHSDSGRRSPIRAIPCSRCARCSTSPRR